MNYRFAVLNFGDDKKNIKNFLKLNDLEYDDLIDFTLICEEDDKIIATASVYKNIIKCIAIDKNYKGLNISAILIEKLTDKMYELNINHIFIFTKPENKKIFMNLGYVIVEESENVILLENNNLALKKDIRSFLKDTENFILLNENNNNLDEKKLKKLKKILINNEEIDLKIGSIIMNLNPMTKGHKYLIEKASNICDFLHIFIVKENLSIFDFNSRYEICKNELKSFNNVILHSSGDYIISRATFPTYFFKDYNKVNDCYAKLDLKIFAKLIAKKLCINYRFVGSEDIDVVTKNYNENMKYILPKYDIKVIEIDRKEFNKRKISASRVRELIKLDDDFLNNYELKNILTDSAYNFLNSNKAKEIIDKIKNN